MKPRAWDEEFDREYFSDEEIEESDKRVAEMQKVIEEAKHESAAVQGM